jgi:hypothetical protein
MSAHPATEEDHMGIPCPSHTARVSICSLAVWISGVGRRFTPIGVDQNISWLKVVCSDNASDAVVLEIVEFRSVERARKLPGHRNIPGTILVIGSQPIA